MRFNRDIARGFAGVAAALLTIASIHFFRPGVSEAPDFPCTKPTDIQGQEVTIDISNGESGSEIAQKLASLGVVKSAAAFFRVAVNDDRSGSISPGSHRINTGICAKLALDQLLDSKRNGSLLIIYEGEWNSEIQSSLVKLGYLKSEVIRAFKTVSPQTPFTSLEGLLFPAQYPLDTTASAIDVVRSLMERGIAEAKAAGFFADGQKFSAQQLLIMASLIQAEGNVQDYQKISQVIRNRLAIGMPLQFDSTVHYIKGIRGSMFLSTKSTLIKSPYNTYRRYGLPPGPINNPGAAAMKAAVNPAAGNWLYFITVAPGDTRFTDNLSQFNTWKGLYKKNLKAGKFRSSN